MMEAKQMHTPAIWNRRFRDEWSASGEENTNPRNNNDDKKNKTVTFQIKEPFTEF